MNEHLTNVLAVIGALWLVLAVAFLLFLAACWAAGVMDRAHRQRTRDAATLACLEDAIDDTPLYTETAAYILRKQLDSDALVSAWLDGDDAA